MIPFFALNGKFMSMTLEQIDGDKVYSNAGHCDAVVTVVVVLGSVKGVPSGIEFGTVELAAGAGAATVEAAGAGAATVGCEEEPVEGGRRRRSQPVPAHLLQRRQAQAVSAQPIHTVGRRSANVPNDERFYA